MRSKSKERIEFNDELPRKIKWYFAPIFASFWLVLYLTVVVNQDNRLPKPLKRRDETDHPDAFIAERAEEALVSLARIGPKVVGSTANELVAVEFLKKEIAKVQLEASDYFEFEVDVQVASGSYIHWSMLNMYQAIQNVVVKLSTRNSTSKNYLLINSHYDSVPGSPGAADDGSMVVIMLEVMRVIAKYRGPLEHPIIFLFNGAEENPLQASHAFITQHKWAKNCKALINLDAAGSGGREALFQSGPGHPWLMKYYRQVPHPFASSVGEEIFQAGLIPSDTDFHIFRDYGGVPGYDMAYIFNGYVYHTAFDRVGIVPKESLQNTGDNVLTLTKILANAPEMKNTSLHTDGYAIYFDFLGWFMVVYTQTTGVVINLVVCFVALSTICASLFFMSTHSGLSLRAVVRRCVFVFVNQIASLLLAAGVTALIAVFMDGIGRPLTWYSENWLLIGLYFCPIFFGMGFLPSYYLEKTKQDRLSLCFRIQLFMHAHCLFLIIFVIVLTASGIRSAFMAVMAILFETTALVINLITKWHRKAYWFAIVETVCQILPFLYFTSTTRTLCLTMIPMMGRSGSASNPDLKMAGIAIFMSILFAGFIMPLFLFFRKTRTIICSFLVITILFIIIAITPVGFPYKARTAVQRYSLIHAHRILHDADNSVRHEEAGIYVYPQDRRINDANDYFKTIGEKHMVSEYCSKEIFCEMPIYNHRWYKARDHSFWIPIEEYPIITEAYPNLILKSTIGLGRLNRRRFYFELSGPDHMTIFIGLKDAYKVTDWTFTDASMRKNWKQPYFIYFSCYNVLNHKISELK